MKKLLFIIILMPFIGMAQITDNLFLEFNRVFVDDLKYTDRSIIDKNYKLKSLSDDILIIKNGFVTDSSYCNIVFFDGLSWVTPKYPLLKGVQRNFLLKNKIIFKKKIKVSDISKYKSFVLINSMTEFNTNDAVNINKINLPLRN